MSLTREVDKNEKPVLVCPWADQKLKAVKSAKDLLANTSASTADKADAAALYDKIKPGCYVNARVSVVLYSLDSIVL
jgi:hypothetical protein